MTSEKLYRLSAAVPSRREAVFCIPVGYLQGIVMNIFIGYILRSPWIPYGYLWDKLCLLGSIMQKAISDIGAIAWYSNIYTYPLLQQNF